MAPRTQAAAALAADERTEREYAADVNNAVAATEDEIFLDAMGEDDLTDDADTSLEEMGEGLEGDDLETDEPAEGEEGEETEAAEGEAGEEARGAEAGDQGDEDQGDQGQRRGEQRQPERQEFRRPGVPPAVHRQVGQRARAAEQTAETERQRADRLERELAETRGRLDMLAQTVTQPRQQQRQEQRPDPEPDIIVEPDKWREWNDRRVQERIDKGIREGLGAVRQDIQARDETRINQSFGELASGPRRAEFNAAHQALLSLDPRSPRDRATVSRIVNSPDPGNALMDWFEVNGAEDFRADMAELLGFGEEYQQMLQEQQREQPRARANNGANRQGGNRQQGNGRQQFSRQNPQGQQQPRSVFRVPPSLSEARGGRGGNSRDGAGQNFDPEMMDDSDDSTFRFAMR
jgi:hypothetical protein